MEHYTYYLSFENSLCKDYITEKLWKILTSKDLIIPLGGLSMEDYKNTVPPNSYIDVQNFSSPTKLAEHLKFVATNSWAFNFYQQ